MSRVEQMQTLAEKMSAMMNQGTIIYSMYQLMHYYLFFIHAGTNQTAEKPTHVEDAG